jgi:hypothetical protein
MANRIPEVLVPTLENYVSLVERYLPNFLNAFYIAGSIALDEFNPHFSDVDFIAVVSHLATKDEVETVHKVHLEVEQRHPNWILSGMYLLHNDLGRPSDEIGERIVFHEGNLPLQNNFEANPVAWWILKHHGISVLGSDPRDLPISVDTKVLVAWTQENMNTYWKSWTQQLGKRMILLTDWGIQWAVLGVARQFYTIREHNIITKRRSGEYALTVIPSQWHRIIKEAIRLRTKADGSRYRFRFARMLDAVNFMKYIIQTSNDYLNQSDNCGLKGLNSWMHPSAG